MKEYLEREIEKKKEQARKYGVVTGICFFGTIIAWFLSLVSLLYFPHLREGFVSFLNQENLPSIAILSLIPVITIVVISIIPFILYTRASLKVGKLEKQLKELEPGEVSK